MPRRGGRAAPPAIAAIGIVATVIVAAVLAVIVPRVTGAPPMPAPADGLATPRFVEEAGEAGVAHAYLGQFQYFVGGGVAVFDCDDDRRPDLYLAGGAAPAAIFRNQSAAGGALRFERLRSAVTDVEAVTGAYPLDVDADGHVDLAVLRVGENLLLRGLGDCRYERANETWGVDGGDVWTAAFSATWEDGETLPTLAFGNYLALDDAGQPTYTCEDHALVRPAREGDGFDTPVALAPGWCTLSMLFSDWDRSGRRDLRVSNDRHYYREGEEQLWRMASGDPPRLYTADEGWQPMRIWGMGIASHDLTGDGYPEVYLTSQGDNKLQALAEGPDRPEYEDIALRRGATAHRPFAGDTTLPSTAWHAEFDDVNNDGFVDLFVSKGNVEDQPDYARRDPNNLLMGRPDGSFEEGAEAAGIVDYARSRGAALADLNLDGLLDLVVVNRRENVRIWRSVGAGTADQPAPLGDWLAVRIRDPERANRYAIGAWVEVRVGDRVMRQEVTVGGGHAGGQLGPLHFGLGEAGAADVRVIWPDGEAGPWLPTRPNRHVDLDRAADEVHEWTPPG